MGRFARHLRLWGLLASLAAALALPTTPAAAGVLPSGFQETTAFSGLTQPTVVRFAPDGTVYVAEKRGLIKTFDGLADTTPRVFADLRTEVNDYWDRGLLGMELDFRYAEYPFVYVLYTHDAAIGGTAPRWGTPGGSFDGCPSPPGGTEDGCVVSGRLSRLVPQPSGGVREDVLIEDWCQQYPSHSVGSLEFDRWGALYASGGDGASFDFVDYGQAGDPLNPCGDPPGGVGQPITPPDAEGGALRSQDVRTAADPTSLDGSVIRVDTDGAPLPANPMFSSTDPNTRRIIASGLRNPFRFDISSTDEVWIGDVGWGTWEEINRLPYGDFRNFGWPCYEGASHQPGYDAADLGLCENLYGQSGSAARPRFAYRHDAKVVAGESCPSGSSAVAGMRFYDGSSFPPAYSDALFFADYARDCIWVMRAGAGGRPDPSTVATFDAGASHPVWIEVGPDGALYYADIYGQIQRIQYTAGQNQAPSAAIDADPRNGPAPLTVNFDGRESSDPDGDPLTYSWDLDGDGQFGDSTSATVSRTFGAGAHVVSLRVTDGGGASGTAMTTIDSGNSAPTPTISAPVPTQSWRAGQTIDFSGSALDPEQGSLPPSGLDWKLILRHCPSNCHSHTLQAFPDRASGSFVAPDHEYPSHLLLQLTATDAGGLRSSTTVRLNPSTVNLTLRSSPPGLDLVLNGSSFNAPFTRELIQDSTNSISAATPQVKGGRSYSFASWSDGRARTHNVKVKTSRTITATFTDAGPAAAARRRR